ncbi:hypothetical protein PMZ80_002195 [Knufia obscura]|uniref:Methyltransferase type 11 domain-containing protein n=2 Tax=Knufia TaxID=430999 RepID=A0AAN8I996_9EURO|nr:hypothetical protein PMZ80_002195 [Knufia obscura]KAK5954005.1 hypothetical protein OHC33_005277 [Knufia fluminis]
MNEERKQQYFAELAPNYHTLTGNTTQDIFAQFLDTYSPKLNITSTSTVHDNAAGPGTATQVLVQRDNAPKIIATDYAPGMIDTLNSIKSANTSANPAWENVTTKVCNSDDLSEYADGTFTHSISNFSLFTITNAVKSLSETHRTLKPDGVAVVLLWKRYAIQSLLAAAQDDVKGAGYAAKNAVPVNGPQYFERDVVPNQVVEAGFEQSKIETWQMDLVVDDEAQKEKWDGLYQFMTSTSVAMGSTRGWSEEEAGRWNEAVRWAMGEEKREFGGLKFEAWVSVARK